MDTTASFVKNTQHYRQLRLIQNLMESLYILIPLSLVAVGVAVFIFFRMNSGGQFDDDQGPAMSILLDDDRPPSTQNTIDNDDENKVQ